MTPTGSRTARAAARRLARLLHLPAAAKPHPDPLSGLSERARHHLALAGRTVATTKAGPVIAHEVDGPRPWHASEELAGRVGRVLASLGVEHWTTQPLGTRITQWAVLQEDLGAVVAALATELGEDTFYLQSPALGGPRLVEEGLTAEEALEPQVLKVFGYLKERSGRLHTDAVACELHPWRRRERGTLSAPGATTGVVQELDDTGHLDTVPVVRWDGSSQPRPAAVAGPDALEIDFNVDAVYMWVDDSDPAWRARREASYRRVQQESGLAGDELAPHRYRDRGELRASLRSLEVNAPWIRRIFLVTDDQRPDWLDPASTRVTVVDHREILPEAAAWPTFNSKVIGSQLHRIPGLASRYLVLNDDVMFHRPVTPYDFFTPQGLLRVTLSPWRRPVISGDRLTPLEQARENSARLIEDLHGRRVTRLFAHVPIPQSLEVARDIEQRFADQIAQTLRHPFRSGEDYEVNAWLHLHHALFTGRAVVGRMTSAYFGVDDPEARRRMGDWRSYDSAVVICVNDRPAADGKDYSAFLSEWLERTWPVPTPYELPRSRP